MNLTNVKLILSREIRDQLRDRRTMFMIFVLPILLYPLLAMSILQVSQFLREQPTTVMVIGAHNLADLPPLFENDRFAAALFDAPEKAWLLSVVSVSDEPRSGGQALDARRVDAQAAVRAGKVDAALIFPDDFAQRLEAFRQASLRRAQQVVEHPDDGQPPRELDVPLAVPSPQLIYSTAKDRSLIAFGRLFDVLRRWNEAVGQKNLAAVGMTPDAATPFAVEKVDVAGEVGLYHAATWAKILPMLLVLWAMTGAFYPAVDLCAGEKERGTLETLLSSPAQRSEIVLGKLATVMLFSMATAVLNLVSMGITGCAVMTHLPGMGSPPPLAAVWLGLALVPVAALFSSLCLALAAFARSTKEGQYYLMPLMLVTMPLAMLPLSPGVELNLGNSLVPVSGLVLLLRSAIQGNTWEALEFLPPVGAVTLACCLLGIRWAVDQFNSESVLFRESERLDVNLWLRHLVRDRQPTPTVAAAVFCGVVVVSVRFFLGMAAPQPTTWRNFAVPTAIVQLAAVLAPTLLMTVVLTGSPTATLLLRRPRWLAVPAAVLLAAALHPAVMMLGAGVMKLYPLNREMSVALEYVSRLMGEAPAWQVLLLVAAAPAICEELAFRGFVLSGFRHVGHKWRAIIYAAVVFGLSHSILQQSVVTTVIGVVLGYLAVQTGSILPGMAFHFTHNALPLAMSRMPPEAFNRWPLLGMLMSPGENGDFAYRWPMVAAGALLAALLLAWFWRLPWARSQEEELQEAIARAVAKPE